MRGHELVTRAELFRDEPEHPRASEEYFKIALGPVQPLPNPVLEKGWKRLTFLYSTGELLARAHTLGDLVVKSEERLILWRSLRERAMNSGQYRCEELPEFELDPALLAMLGVLTGK